MDRKGLTLGQIADAVGGRLKGNTDKEILNVAPFDEASETDIVFAGSAKFLKRLHDTGAGAVIVPADFDGNRDNLIFVAHPQIAFNQVTRLFYPEKKTCDAISPSASIGDHFRSGADFQAGPSVVIGNHVTVGSRIFLHPGVVIGDHVILGDDVCLHANVTVLERCVIGSRVTIHAGTVIGSDGFGFAPQDGKYHKIPHTGIVRIEDDVELGALNAIDRGTMGETVIGKGVRTDNLVHVAHNVVLGENTILVAQVGIAGSTKIGKNVIIAGQAGISGHLTIGDNTIIGPKAGIVKSTPGNEIISGIPGMPHKDWLKSHSIAARLPELKKKITQLEKRLEMLENDRKEEK
ncbi:MAG: UDP-3-O-(3-hydroxymyristoyl)glucosamine N-acyltransferase [Proteobacteria bacterium]|nr:UDP-3-O-(3-hydroxymyristoyl)glucosamine N-acyltransferase [Pseudomonadota bacterium]